MDLVIFASAYWDEVLWTNKQHVALRLARRHRVLYVEPGFSRTVLAARLSRPPRREGQAIGPVPAPPDAGAARGLEILSPILLPLRRGPESLRAIAYRILAARVRRVLARWGSRRFALLIYYPEGIRLADHLAPDVVAYDCVDDLATQPHIASRPGLARSLAASEDRLIARADLVFATSPDLASKVAGRTSRCHYVPNVADFDHFAAPRAEPPALAAVPRPRAAYSGALDPYKVDYPLLHGVLDRLPDLSLVLIGPAETAGPNAPIARLAAHPRVHRVPPLPYTDLPAYLQAMDVLLMPYVISEHTRHIFPLKVHEYLATGRPVVSTPLPALAALTPVIPLARTAAEWQSALERALAAAGAEALAGRQARQDVARASTWEVRVGRIEMLLASALEGSAPRASAPQPREPRAR
jgi:glycosyltransferase involved in cell wall biosynthesis